MPLLGRLFACFWPGEPHSIPGQSMCDMRWSYWHFTRFFSEYFCIPSPFLDTRTRSFEWRWAVYISSLNKTRLAVCLYSKKWSLYVRWKLVSLHEWKINFIRDGIVLHRQNVHWLNTWTVVRYFVEGVFDRSVHKCTKDFVSLALNPAVSSIAVMRAYTFEITRVYIKSVPSGLN